MQILNVRYQILEFFNAKSKIQILNCLQWTWTLEITQIKEQLSEKVSVDIQIILEGDHYVHYMHQMCVCMYVV